ncbi:Cro/CI family transcriptional regulator [Streptococcus varani]|uniref:Cro/CI family transcriptional regulator n=1 Tax=Streptococcus varani TaxID=1608583 RepID=A0A0E4CRL2_9STRE|nr:S24 family peptidase [Streptococcus varani]CQR23630.1 Cro/CI family transcriptional regulator [Streptococcus varani]
MIEKQLRELMELRFGSVKAFAVQNDIPYSTVRSILERGVLKSNSENIFKICSILGIDPKALVKNITFIPDQPEIVSIYKQLESERQEVVLNTAKEQLEEQNKVVSMFDKKIDDEDYITDYVEGLVAAGLGTFQEDNLHMEVQLRSADIPDKYDTIAKVAGDSMEPLIQDNDLLFINITSQVDINDIGIFQINGKNFVKKLKRDYDGTWYLQSLNNVYEEIYLSEYDNIRTIGEVVDIYRD